MAFVTRGFAMRVPAHDGYMRVKRATSCTPRPPPSPHNLTPIPPRFPLAPIPQYDIELLQSPPLAVGAQGPEFVMHYLKLLRAAETRGKLEIDQ